MIIVDKSLFDLHKDLLYVCVYIPPESSRFHKDYDISGKAMLESCLFGALSEND